MKSKKMYMAFSISLIMVFAALFLIEACSKPAPTTAPTSAPTAAPAAKPLKLILASFYPQSYYGPNGIIEPVGVFANNAKKRLAKINVDLQVYFNAELLDVNELIPGLEKGTADLIFTTPGNTTGAWPVMGIIAVPFFFETGESSYKATMIGGPLRQAIDKQLETKHNVKLIGFGITGLNPIIFIKKKVMALSDMQGLKIRGLGTASGWAIQAYGASPVNMPSGEMYEAASKGIVDALISSESAIWARKLYEVGKYIVSINFGADGATVFMKKDKWNALPQEARDILTETAQEYEYQEAYYVLGRTLGYEETFRKTGVEMYNLPAAESASIKALTQDKVWAKAKETFGPELSAELFKYAAK